MTNFGAGYIGAFVEYQAYQPIVAAILLNVNQHALSDNNKVKYPMIVVTMQL